MNLREPYNTWLTKHIGTMVDPKLRYVLRVGAATSQGETTLDLGLDLSWFILVQIDDEDSKKLEMVLELLKTPEFIEQFKATLRIPEAKRFFSEFLLYNYYFLDGLKSYIDFTVLNIPMDFISQALFMKFSVTPDTDVIDSERIKIVKLVLDTGFVLTGDYPINSVGFAVRKVLLMQQVPDRFQVARRMLETGFQLFTNIPANNSELAVELINNRADADCLAIIKNNIAAFKEITLSVAGSSGGSNLADYFYWVKEDMSAVNFIRDAIGLDISP